MKAEVEINGQYGIVIIRIAEADFIISEWHISMRDVRFKIGGEVYGTQELLDTTKRGGST